MVYRLEAKKAVRRVKKVDSALMFEAQISRDSASTALNIRKRIET